MKRLVSDLYGGYPFELDDMRWMEDGIIEVIEAILRAYEPVLDEGYILSGMEYTDTGGEVYDVSAGWIVIRGQACYYPGGTGLDASSGTAYWYQATTYDASGNETFEDASVQDTYKIVQAEFATGTPPASFTDFECTRLADNIANLLSQHIPEFIGPLSTPPSSAMENGWATGLGTYHDLEWRKSAVRSVQIRGAVNGVAATDNQVCVLPSTFRPQKQITVTLHSVLDASHVALCNIAPTGEITIGSYGNVNDLYDLSALPPFEKA